MVIPKKYTVIPLGIIISLVLIAVVAFLIIGNQVTLTETSVDKEITAEATAIGNISYEKVKSDTSINTIIDSSQKLDNGNLLVKFHHNSNKEEPISVVGAVRYELSKVTAKPNEEITLTVFDWGTEYFEIEIGEQSIKFGFGEVNPLL